MNITKRKILDLPGVYSTAILNLGERTYFAVASENRGEKNYIIDSESLEYSLLWDDGDAGVMNIVQIAGEEKLLVITKFYPVFQSKEAEICLLEPTEKGYLAPWKKKTVLSLPYTHRIGCFKSNGEDYLVAATLCKDKDFVDDWTKPGAVYFISCKDWKERKVLSDLTKNHGLWIDGSDIYITAENGVFRFDVSSYSPESEIKVVKLSDNPTSDISVSDAYFATIEPFHGNSSALYDRKYSKIESFTLDFGHVVWTGKIKGRDAVIHGNRGGDKALILTFLDNGETVVIDSGIGPTQISVIGNKILSANHGSGDVSLYSLE